MVGIAGGILSEIIIILGILLVIYIVFKLGKVILGLLVNVILGFIAIFLVNAIFGLGIMIDLWVLIIIAILGLPGVALIVLLHLIGINL